MTRLAGRVALVTGGARGLGAAVAGGLAGAGARVVLSDFDEAEGRATAARLGTDWMLLDVREEMAWIATLARLLDSHGRLDVLVLAAGVTGLEHGAVHDPEHASLTDWRAVQRSNLDAVFLGCKHGLRALRRGGGGSIIHVGHTPADVCPASAAALAASQAAARRHLRTLALYAAAQGLRVRTGCIARGAPDTVAGRALLLA